MKLGEFEINRDLRDTGDHEVGAPGHAERIHRLQAFAPFELMKFRLTYDGELKASGNKSRRAAEKWAIRHALQPQLIELCATHPALRAYDFNVPRPLSTEDRLSGTMRLNPKFDKLLFLRTSIRLGGKAFMPLVRSSLHLACKLDITFMRKDEPGKLVLEGGDIDNRLKTLFDGLSMPNANEVDTGNISDAPFHCLLESDSLITGFTVDTDRLLGQPDADPSQVHLVIQCTAYVTHVTDLNVGFIGD